MAKKIRDTFNAKGKVTSLSDVITIERNGLPDITKRMLGIELTDGQLVFVEARNHKMSIVSENNVKEGDDVQFTFSFEGSQKNGKQYNNIYLHEITVVKYE